jgi:Reverse transcriptase (RNA-dependent DNA polymerase)
MAEAFCDRFFISPHLTQTNTHNIAVPSHLERGVVGCGTPCLTMEGYLGNNVRDVPLTEVPLPFPKLLTCSYLAITSHKITAALQTCANKSALGLTGIPYKLIQWANDTHPDLLPLIFNTMLHLGVHPWTEAKVVIIPKPGKSDYSTPKSYRPISLLECIGKVLEKIIAQRLSWDIDHFNLLGPSQFVSLPGGSNTRSVELEVMN